MVIDVGRRRVTVFGPGVILTAHELELSYTLMHPYEPIHLAPAARSSQGLLDRRLGDGARPRALEEDAVDPANPVLIRTVLGRWLPVLTVGAVIDLRRQVERVTAARDDNGQAPPHDLTVLTLIATSRQGLART